MGTFLRLPLFWTTLTDVRSTGQIFSTTHSIWVLLDVAVTMTLGLWVSEKKTREVRHPRHDTKSGVRAVPTASLGKRVFAHLSTRVTIFPFPRALSEAIH